MNSSSQLPGFALRPQAGSLLFPFSDAPITLMVAIRKDWAWPASVSGTRHTGVSSEVAGDMREGPGGVRLSGRGAEQ